MRLLVLILLFTSLWAAPASFFNSGNSTLTVNNRVLLKINGKPLSVVDVVKKMDLLFYRQHPEMVDIPYARYEFYLNHWQLIFTTLVNDMLIEADAEEKQVTVTDGDVREDMESLFGPNVVANINRVGLSFEEAWDLLKRELVTKKMTQMMVRSKAAAEVQPKEMIALYEEYQKRYAGDEKWVYQILTIKGSHPEQVLARAEEIHASLVEKKGSFDEVQSDERVAVEKSEEYTRVGNEISELHREILAHLDGPGYTKPEVQKRGEGTYVAKIFFLKEHNKEETPSFAKVEKELYQRILQKRMAVHSEEYALKLRERYGLTDKYLSQMIPADFQPIVYR